MSKADPSRLKQLSEWTSKTLLPTSPPQPSVLPMKAVGGDAGFRHYYRIQTPDGTVLAVDAPPETEDSRAFVSIAGMLKAGGINVPDIKAVDYSSGFLLVEDFGDRLLLGELSDQTADIYYRQALLEIINLQKCSAEALMPYSRELLTTELGIYKQWFLGDLLGLSVEDHPGLHDLFFTQLVDSALRQPQAMVHRDFHSRNLLLLPENRLGVIDFQGALSGPALYDAVSLLKDCYISWPRSKVENWLRYFVNGHPHLHKVGFETCLQWFDWIGLQRHLKCLGIFSRLWFRDGKADYLKEIPMVFNYALEVCHHYPELESYGLWLTDHVMPILQQRLDLVQAGIEQ
ncbi:aminoglycoside phosphotransferase [Endozoicomonas sp. OPT23]|uniref:aminoglycoside phosphotransferase family protein n=1 Tax=Endozoicomonas sp. OPT23 TaxID=2072845 RepID=UPI00129BF148|nr:phosphotransferase [Endozoicomonas sp. OPT23]MRI33694.1 aminoglycoside phosphotransferase [Endozoicomonas sp. OPT23]